MCQVEDVPPSHVLYAAVGFVVSISTMIVLMIGTTRVSKTVLLSGRKMISKGPFNVLVLLILMTCFADHADALDDSLGPCLQASYGINPLECTAKDISSSIVSFSGPNVCIQGSIFEVNISTQVTINAENRYNLGLYLGLNGANALSAPGESCIVQSLVPADAANNVPNVYPANSDSCYDFKNMTNNTIIAFQLTDLQVLCNSASESGLVTISTCLVWAQNDNSDCDNEGLLPGTSSVSLLYILSIFMLKSLMLHADENHDYHDEPITENTEMSVFRYCNYSPSECNKISHKVSNN